jgi:hypothetical protein
LPEAPLSPRTEAATVRASDHEEHLARVGRRSDGRAGAFADSGVRATGALYNDLADPTVNLAEFSNEVRASDTSEGSPHLVHTLDLEARRDRHQPIS